MATDTKPKHESGIDDEDEILEIDPKDKKKKEQLAKKEKKAKEKKQKADKKKSGKNKPDKKEKDESIEEISELSLGESGKKKKSKGKRGKLLAILIFLLLAAAIGSIFVFNPFGIRDKYVYGLLQKIPIVQNIVKVGDGQEALTTDELHAQIADLRKQISILEEEKESLQSRNNQYVSDMALLQQQATQWGDFKAEKDAFDREIAMANPSEYISYYESISSTNQEQLYEEASDIVQRNKDFKKYIATFQDMDESSAAKIFEELMTTADIDLVVTILNSLNSEHAAAILSAMAPENSAVLARRMAPENQ